MGYDGNGNFNRQYRWQDDAANGINIRADRMDGEHDDFATGLSLAFTRDGQSVAAADIDFGNNRIIRLADPVNDTDAVNKQWASTNFLGSANTTIAAAEPGMIFEETDQAAEDAKWGLRTKSTVFTIEALQTDGSTPADGQRFQLYRGGTMAIAQDDTHEIAMLTAEDVIDIRFTGPTATGKIIWDDANDKITTDVAFDPLSIDTSILVLNQNAHSLTIKSDVTDSDIEMRAGMEDGNQRYVANFFKADALQAYWSFDFDDLAFRFTKSIQADGWLEVNPSTGGLALTTNDGYGNAQITFNHTAGVPDQAGTSARITVNTDSTDGGNIAFQVEDGVEAGVANTLVTKFQIVADGEHQMTGDFDISGNLDVGSVEIDAAGGILMGNSTVGSGTDLSKHLQLYTGYGMSVTSGTLNIVSGSAVAAYITNSYSEFVTELDAYNHGMFCHDHLSVGIRGRNLDVYNDAGNRYLWLYSNNNSTPGGYHMNGTSGALYWRNRGGAWNLHGTFASDANLKDMKDDVRGGNWASDIVSSFDLKKYTWKDSDEEGFGVIAQDVAAKYPTAHRAAAPSVSDPKGKMEQAVYSDCVDTGQMIGLLVKALQEANDRIAALEA